MTLQLEIQRMKLNGEVQTIYNEMCKLIHNRNPLEILIGNQIVEAQVITGDVNYTTEDGTMRIELEITGISNLDGN